MKKIIPILSIFICSMSLAGEYTGAAKITKFRAINATGKFIIMGQWDTSNADGCTNTNKWVVGEHSNYSSTEALNSAYSTIVAAYMSNKTVELYIDGCDSSNQPIVSAIWLPSRY